MRWRHVETCEPLGPDECQGCAEELKMLGRARGEARALRRGLRAALRQIDRLAGAMESERSSAGAEEVRSNPILAGHSRRIETARRVAARLEPLTLGVWRNP